MSFNAKVIQKILKPLNHGAEIGGQSHMFNAILPLYPYCRRLDGYNMITSNYWQKEFADVYICAGVQKGLQYDMDAATMTGYPEHMRGAYDFVMSCHVLEHIANPIQALCLWRELMLKPGGYIVSVIPAAALIWDAPRKITTLAHLVSDYGNGTGEDDRTHIDDALNNIRKDDPNLSYGDYVRHAENNAAMRVIHHHTFNMELVKGMHEYAGYKTLVTMQTGYHLIYLGRV